jgi:hypothetical protein
MVFKAAAALLMDSPLWPARSRCRLALVAAVAALAWVVAASLPRWAEPGPRIRRSWTPPMPRGGACGDRRPAAQARRAGSQRHQRAGAAFPGADWAHWLHRFRPVVFSFVVALALR